MGVPISLRLRGSEPVRYNATRNRYWKASMTNTPTLLTEADVAQRLQVSMQTVRRWRQLGCGPVYVKLAKFVRYRPADLDLFEATALRRETGWRQRQLAAA